MSDPHEYRGTQLHVIWDKHRCMHSAECLRRLPEVFDTRRKPWVNPDAGALEAVVKTVEACPSGALTYQRHDGSPAESAPPTNSVTVMTNGPLYLRGDLEITNVDGEVLHRETRVALCRCGASERKPFCDNTHTKCGFRDTSPFAARPANDELEPIGKLTVRLAPHGPLILRGAVTVQDRHGKVCARTDKVSLCRCGASASRPFCDGSHNGIGFQAP